MELINFDEVETTPSVFTDKLTKDNAIKVLRWIDKVKKQSKRGYFYEVDGSPVIATEDSVLLKRTLVAQGWLDKSTKLSTFAYNNNKKLAKIDYYHELLVIAEIADEDDEDDEIDM